MTVDPVQQRADLAGQLEQDTDRQAELTRLAAHVKGRRAKWAHRSPAHTIRDQDADFDAAEAAAEHERDRRV